MREGENVCASVSVREWESMCVSECERVRMCVRLRVRESETVRVSVRERVKMCVCQ